MKQFFENYGAVALGILALLVLIAMITPVGNIVKTSLQGTAHKFSSSINSQTDAMTEDMNKMLENSIYVSEYAKEVLSKQRLYDVGEQNLTVSDIVTINGIECYVLEATASAAKLITKDIYNVRFDTGGHTADEVGGYVGTDSSYTDKTYNYDYSVLKSWMSQFYLNQLNEDERIISNNGEYVKPLDFESGLKYDSKFRWDYNTVMQINDDGTSSSYNAYYFWLDKGIMSERGYSMGQVIRCDGEIRGVAVQSTYAGARPVFWISLE